MSTATLQFGLNKEIAAGLYIHFLSPKFAHKPLTIIWVEQGKIPCSNSFPNIGPNYDSGRNRGSEDELKSFHSFFMKLLIVENSLSVRQILKSVVAPVAEEIIECGDGAEAVSLYEAGLPDFVLMDIDLGEMDGITATRRINANDPNAKIIIVTNYDETDLREEARLAGACGYVLKENLLKVLEHLQTNPNL